MKTLILILVFLNIQIWSQSFLNEPKLSDKYQSGRSLIIKDKINQVEKFNQNSFYLKNLNGSLCAELNKEKSFAVADSNIKGTNKKKKSVALGILLSALVPGAGEFYGESYLKAGIFLGIEIIAWTGYFYFNSKGDKQTEEFENFADANWDVRRYARWLNDEFDASLNPNEPNLEQLRLDINEFESAHFSHTLPPYGTQQYYELIGKYQNFMGGWADAESNGTWIVTQGNFHTYQTPMFKGYAVDRQDANDFYDYATTTSIVVIANHILSAADAAWTISTYNSKIKVETGFRLENYFSPYTYKWEQKPTFNMKVTF
jgi:hypothetical protein